MSLKVPQKKAVALFLALGMPMAAKWTAERLKEKLLKLPATVDEDTEVEDKKLAKLLEEIVAAVKDETKIKIVADEEDADEDEDEKPKKKAKDEDDDEEDDDDEKPKKKKKSKDEDEDDDEDDEDDEPKKKSKSKDEDDEDDEDEAPKKKKKSKDEDEDDEDEDEKPKKKKKSSDDDEDDDDDDKPKKKKKAFGEGAGGPGKPGVIASIQEFLTNASEEKPLSKKKLCKKLKERFPDRDEDSMLRTINVQVPNRLKADKGLKVSKNDDGYWIDMSKQEKKEKKKGDDDDDD